MGFNSAFKGLNFPRFKKIIYFYVTIWRWILVKINFGGVFLDIQNDSVIFYFTVYLMQ